MLLLEGGEREGMATSGRGEEGKKEGREEPGRSFFLFWGVGVSGCTRLQLLCCCTLYVGRAIGGGMASSNFSIR